MKTSPGGATDPPSSRTGQPLPARTDSSRPLRSRRKDAKTGRQWHPAFVPPPFASLRLCVSQSGPPRDSWFHPSQLTSEQVHHRHETYSNGIPPTAPFASSRLRVSPFGPIPGAWPQKSQKVAKGHCSHPTCRRTDTPPADDEPARQTLASRVGIGIGIGIGIENSRRRTGSDPDTPRQLRVFPSRGPRPGGPSDDSPARERWVPSPHDHAAPARATDSPLLHTPNSNSPLGRIPHARFAQDAKTPRQARNGIQSSSLPPSRAPLLPETHFHAETPSPPRLEYPSSRLSWMRTEALLERETKVQKSAKMVAAIHRLLPGVVQLTAQFIRTIRNETVLRMRWLAALAPLRIFMAAYL